MAKKSKVRHTKVDKYSAQANATRGEREKLIANLPSSRGLPIVDKPNTSTKKKAPTS